MYINSICTAVHFWSLFRFTVQGFKSIDDILYLYFISELITWQNVRIESMCSSSLYISPMEKLPAFFALWFITWDKKQICWVKQNVLGKCPKYRVKWVRTVMKSTCAVWIVAFLGEVATQTRQIKSKREMDMIYGNQDKHHIF